MQASLTEIIELMLVVPLVVTLLWLIKNRKNAQDIICRYFRRGKCVKIRFRTVANNVLYKYRVPDSHGMVMIDGGLYHYQKECAVYDSNARMFEITFIENQMEPVTGEVLVSEKEVKVKVKENGRKVEKSLKVPTGIIDYTELRPRMVTLPNVYNENGDLIEQEQSYTAQAVKEFSDDHVASDIVKSSSKSLEDIKTILMITIGLGLVAIVTAYLVYDGFKRLDARVDTLNAQLIALKGLTH